MPTYFDIALSADSWRGYGGSGDDLANEGTGEINIDNSSGFIKRVQVMSRIANSGNGTYVDITTQVNGIGVSIGQTIAAGSSISAKVHVASKQYTTLYGGMTLRFFTS